MQEYDEYQNSLRYKNGYYAFIFINALLLVNALIGPWAETRELEYYLIMVIAAAFMAIRNTFQGAYLTKSDNPLRSNALLVVFGLLYTFLLFQLNDNLLASLFVDGKLSYRGFYLVLSVVYLSIPLTYFINLLIEKRKND